MKSKLLTALCLCGAGVLLTLSFSPYGIWPLAILSPSVLFYFWMNDNKKEAFFHGLYFGLGFFSSGTYWTYIALHQYGGMPITLSVLLSILVIIFLSAFIGANGLLNLLLSGVQSRRKNAILIYPGTWILFEWIRSHVFFNGFPWLLVGYSQTDSVLNSLSPIIGVFGLSLVTILMAASFSTLARQFRPKLAITFGVMVALLFSIAFTLKGISYTQNKNQIRVALVQGNVQQTVKWNPSQLPFTLKRYYDITNKIKQKTLIVWPEGAVPTFPQLVPNFITSTQNMLKRTSSRLLFGTELYNKAKNEYYNGMVFLGGNRVDYHKQRLVPFGEYYPLQFISKPMLHFLNLPSDGYTPGQPHQPLMQFNNTKIATFICYEIAYPSLVLKESKTKNLIVVISDDSWFGNSIALPQQLQISKMRALETGRYVLACNNTGITAIINPKGQIISQAPAQQVHLLKNTVTSTAGETPLMITGYAPTWFASLILTLMGVNDFSSRQERRSNKR